MTVPLKEAPANPVPAAAVRREEQALSGFIGCKGFVSDQVSQILNISAQLKNRFETARIEFERGKWNCRCSGEMRRYRQEHQLQRLLSISILTLRNESMGSNRD